MNNIVSLSECSLDLMIILLKFSLKNEQFTLLLFLFQAKHCQDYCKMFVGDNFSEDANLTRLRM